MGLDAWILSSIPVSEKEWLHHLNPGYGRRIVEG